MSVMMHYCNSKCQDLFHWVYSQLQVLAARKDCYTKTSMIQNVTKKLRHRDTTGWSRTNIPNLVRRSNLLGQSSCLAAVTW